MKKHYQFQVNEASSLEDAQIEADRIGLEDAYTVDDLESCGYIIGGFGVKIKTSGHKHLSFMLCEEGIDWSSQSEQFSPYFEEGMIKVPMCLFEQSDKILTLKPGEGFGDMSHVTTEMSLQLIAKEVSGKCILDIGCGSGVLSLAAEHLGALYAIGIDIEPSAVEHAKENQKLNESKNVEFLLDIKKRVFKQKIDLAVMNMTLFEQKLALGTLDETLKDIPRLITSGILEEQQKGYLEFMESIGWLVDKSLCQDKWMAFSFHRKKL